MEEFFFKQEYDLISILKPARNTEEEKENNELNKKNKKNTVNLKQKKSVKFGPDEIFEVECWKTYTALMHFEGGRTNFDYEPPEGKKRKQKKEKKERQREIRKAHVMQMKKQNVKKHNIFENFEHEQEEEEEEEENKEEEEENSKNKNTKGSKKKQKQTNIFENFEKQNQQKENSEDEEDLEKKIQLDNSFKLHTFQGKCQETLSEHSDWINFVSNISDTFLISGSDDKSIKFWFQKRFINNQKEEQIQNQFECIKTLTFENDIKSLNFDLNYKIQINTEQQEGQKNKQKQEFQNFNILYLGLSNGNIIGLKIPHIQDLIKEQQYTDVIEIIKNINSKTDLIYNISSFHKDQVNGIYSVFIEENKLGIQNEQNSSNNSNKKKKKRHNYNQNKNKIIQNDQNKRHFWISYSLDNQILLWGIKDMQKYQLHQQLLQNLNNDNNIDEKERQEQQQQSQLQNLEIIVEYTDHQNIMTPNSFLLVKDDLFLSVCTDCHIRLYQINQKAPTFKHNTELEGLYCIERISPIEEKFVRQFAIGSEKTIVLFEFNNQFTLFSQFIRIPQAHESYINAMFLVRIKNSYLDNGQKNNKNEEEDDEEKSILGTVSHDFKLKIWEIDQEEYQTDEKYDLRGHANDILNITQFNQQIITCSTDNTIKIWS